MNYFNEMGVRIPSQVDRVFGEVPEPYYRLHQPAINYSKILENSINFGGISSETNLSNFETKCEQLKSTISANTDFKNLLNGVHIPFICNSQSCDDDLGKELEATGLLNVSRSFNATFPHSHFKAVLQSNSQLSGKVMLDARSRYSTFLKQSRTGTLVGWYFPQALQGFDIESQRDQMTRLPSMDNICLSGGIDVTAALTGTPELLISDEFYPPVLCLSAYVHSDARLVLLLKSYGPHMEFWCMTQMMTKDVTQVSEQWAGGLSFYTQLSN